MDSRLRSFAGVSGERHALRRIAVDEIQEILMHGRIAGQLRMKSRGEDASLPDQRWLARIFGQDFDARADVIDDRPTNEYHFHRLRLQLCRTEEDVAGQLAAVSVAQHRHVQKAERVLRRVLHRGGKQDCTGTGAENRMLVRSKFLNRFEQTFFLQELQLRGGFAAGKNQRVTFGEIGDSADFEGLRAEGMQHRSVSGEISLDGEDSDFGFFYLCHSSAHPRIRESEQHRSEDRPLQLRENRQRRKAAATKTYQPRVERRSLSGIWRKSRPGMASPRSSLASRTAFGSSKWVQALTTALARASGSLDLKMPEPTKTASAPRLRTSAASAGVAMPPAEKFGTGSLPVLATWRTSSSGAPSSLASRINSSSRRVVSFFI